MSRKALIIGIDHYPGAPLKGCIADAHAMDAVLETNGDGSPNFHVRRIVSSEGEIERATLRESIEALFSGDPEIALLYFSGHGHISSSGGHIVSQDFRKYDEGVSMDEILVWAKASKARAKVVILDCCYSGAFGSPATGDGSATLCEGLSVLTACRSTEGAVEQDGAGIFTSLVVSGLNGGAADITGNVTPGSIYAYVDKALGEWGQRPIFKTNVSRFISLRKAAPQMATETLRRIVDYFPDVTDAFNLDPSYEFTNSSSMPPPKITLPEADEAHVAVMKDLQKMAGVGLVVPIDEEHMYFAAMNSKSCKLTALGAHYWRLVKEKHI